MSRDRLEKLLGMLGSAHDGERASAALKIADMAKTRGITIVSLIIVEFQGAPSFIEERTSQDALREQLDELLKDVSVVLKGWDADFVRSMTSNAYKDRVWTDRQIRKALEIVDKYTTQKVGG